MTDAADRQPETPPREFSGRVGKYQIVRPLGRGAMGMVYLAHDTVLERDVALKVMVSQMGDDPLVQERFAREARAVAKMTHPNVVTVFDLGNHTDGSPYIAMELLKGQDLAKALRTPPPMPLPQKISVILQVLAGLAHAHQAGIIHRDIKPANIFINNDGTVKLMDFGVARLTTASLTGTGNIVGTADYMSPEQVKGAKVDGRSDLFSVGCLLFEMVTGRRPFHADNLMAIFYKITHEEPAFDQLPPGLEHEALRPILYKAMAKDLSIRYSSAYEFAVDLREYLKRHASPSALEGLLEVEPPSPIPGGPTLVVGDDVPSSRTFPVSPTQRVDLPSTAGRPATGLGATAPGAVSPTVRAPEMRPPRPPTVRRPPPTRVVRAAPEPPPSRRRSPVLVAVVIGSVAAVVVAVAALLVRQRPGGETLPPPPSQAAATTVPAAPQAGPTATPEAAPSPAPPTAPPVVPSAGATPVPAESRRPADRAAADRAAADRAAADRAAADRAAEAERLQRAQREAQERQAQEDLRRQQSSAQAQVSQLVGQADSALAGQKYDAAINLYNEALKLDPQNARALQGRSDAVSARALVAAGATGTSTAPLRSFVAGKTSATSADVRASKDTPDGFEVTPDVQVQRATQAGALPGKIHFDVQPPRVKAGDPYKVRVYFVNEGNAPIQIREMVIGGRVNGRLSAGPVPPLASNVAPQDRVLLREMPDLWKEDTTSWQMEVTVRTARGETYRNDLTWK
jgi:eukaryotic-like serine/threonine-protein kinase